MWQLETPKNVLNDYLHGYLGEREQEFGTALDAGEAFRILTTPLEESILTREQRRLASIAGTSDEEKKLARHAKKYEWIEYGLQGRLLSIEHFQDELRRVKAGNPEAVLARIRSAVAETRRKQREIVSLLHIDRTHRRIFRIVRDSLHARLFSKLAQFYGYYALEALLGHIGSRHGLSLKETKFLSLPDYYDLLIRGKRSDFAARACEQKEYSVHISDRGKTKLWRGEDARRIMAHIRIAKEEILTNMGESMKGQVAFRGQAKGRVKLINTMEELVKMHKGNILVSHMTNPDIVPAMKLAAAIVTDLGGITCHAAIVSRELGVPCVIGTKIATKVFKDGDMVEVDAERGIVKKLLKSVDDRRA